MSETNDKLNRIREDLWLCMMTIQSPSATEEEKRIAQQRAAVLGMVLDNQLHSGVLN